jgi:nonribosomal peptide synthetase protein VioG
MVSDNAAGGFRWPADRLLTEDERRVWRDFNQTAAEQPPHALRLLPWFARAARHNRERIAVAAAGRTLTYGDLDDRSDAIASRLRAVGVGPRSVVAITATRTVSPYPALLAALKTGAAYVPVNPDDPAERLMLMLEDCQAAVLLADSASAEKLASLCEHLGTCATVEEGPAVPGWEDWSAQPQANGRVEITDGPTDGRTAEDTTAYVIYTSGSTGCPKGVRVAESSLLNLTHWVIDRHDVRSDDRLAQNAPLTFDPSVQQIFPAWVTGACLVVMPQEALLDAYELLTWLRQEDITHLDIVTPHWLQLLEAAVANPSLRALPHLRWTIVGGESFSYQHTRQWYEVVQSPGRLNNIYGPTEATVNATEIEVQPQLSAGKVPIGRPLPNYRLYVLDEAGELCPPGVQGELYIAGAGLAQGYCSAEATRRAWLVHRVLDGRAERLYRTGDLARMVQDAADEWQLEFCGRADRQVKISGYRLELEEIEMAAKSCPGVRDAVVITAGDPPDQLVCFVVGDEDDPALIRQQLSAKLPSYMVPHLVVPVTGMPLTPSGKIDHTRLLQELERARDRGPVAAMTMSEVEQAIAEAFSAVLGTRVTSPGDDFFLLGGSSLLALRVAGRLRETGLALRASDLLQHPSVGTLAAHISARTDES